MQDLDRPSKTAAARTAMSQRQVAAGQTRLAPALRMLLITVDGRATVAELMSLGRSLGLADSALHQLQQAGLIECVCAQARAREQAREQALALAQELRARQLVNAKMFALDLASRMLAGQEGVLREQMREVKSETAFGDWLARCETTIACAADPQRARFFRSRVEAALPTP